MKIIFDTYIDNTFDGRYQSAWRKQALVHNYQIEFPPDRQAPLLDVGIGRGEMLSLWQKLGYTSGYGVDISPSTVEFCQKLGLTCELIEDTVKFLQSKVSAYSLITLIDVLEHIPKENLPGFLTALHDALDEDGKLIIQVPNMQAPESYLHRYNDLTHEVGFCEHSLQQILQATKFEIIEFKGFEEYFGNTPQRILRRVVRRAYLLGVRLLRNINGNLNPRILHPILIVIVRKKREKPG